MTSAITASPGYSSIDQRCKPRSLWSDAWRRLVASGVARAGMVIIILFALMSVLPPILAPYNPRHRLGPGACASSRHRSSTSSAPTPRAATCSTAIVQAARVSLGMGLGAVSIAVLVGTLLGLISGFVGKSTDLVLMFCMDILLAFPGHAAGHRPGLHARPRPGQLADGRQRGQHPGLRAHRALHRAFAEGARVRDGRPVPWAPRARASSSGTSCPTACRRSSSSPPWAWPPVILEIAALGFLGLGAQPPTPEWGAMLADGYKYLTSGSWWVLVLPRPGHRPDRPWLQPGGRRPARCPGPEPEGVEARHCRGEACLALTSREHIVLVACGGGSETRPYGYPPPRHRRLNPCRISRTPTASFAASSPAGSRPAWSTRMSGPWPLWTFARPSRATCW